MKQSSHTEGHLPYSCFILFSFRKQFLPAFVFMFCCKSASYMSFTFVFLKDLFYLPCKLGRDHSKLFGKILMYRGFAYPERRGCGTNGGFGVYHMLCELYAPFIFPVIHKTHSNTFWCIKVYAIGRWILLFRKENNCTKACTVNPLHIQIA